MNKQITPDKRVKKFNFAQLQYALIGFLADFDKKLNDIVSPINDDDGVPVYCHGLDSGYFMRKKFTINEFKDLYMKTPRVIIKFDDTTDSKDMNGSQDVRSRYIFNEQTYEAFFRRKTKVMTITGDVITSNYIRALEYYEILESMMRKVVPYTYEFLGNTQFGAYELMSNLIQNPSLDASNQNKDFKVQFTMELQVNLWSINYSSIREINVFRDINLPDDEGDGFEGDGGKTEKGNNKVNWQINSKTTDENGTDIDHIVNMETPHNPNCLGCKICDETP